MSIEIASAQLLRPDKCEDKVLVKILNDGRYLVAVADGLSLSAGRFASELVITILTAATEVTSARSIFEYLRTALIGMSGEHPESETTLTCALISEVDSFGVPYLRCEYFAIGDSPIWRVARAPIGDRYAFQRYLVHGPPYPGETAKVYATVRSRRDVDIKGSVAFGCVEIPSNEVLVICTDGIPEREIFGREQSMREPLSDRRPLLCEWMFAEKEYDDNDAHQVLRTYDERGVLYDDATLVAVRLRMAAQAVEAADAIGDSSRSMGLSIQQNAGVQQDGAAAEFPIVDEPYEGEVSPGADDASLREEHSEDGDSRVVGEGVAEDGEFDIAAAVDRASTAASEKSSASGASKRSSNQATAKARQLTDKKAKKSKWKKGPRR